MRAIVSTSAVAMIAGLMLIAAELYMSDTVVYGEPVELCERPGKWRMDCHEPGCDDFLIVYGDFDVAKVSAQVEHGWTYQLTPASFRKWYCPIHNKCDRVGALEVRIKRLELRVAQLEEK